MAQITPEQLIEKIIVSTPFAKAEKLCLLLRFLAKNRNRLLTAARVEEEHLGRPPLHPQHNPPVTIATLNELKKKLEQYAAQAPENERLRCELPDAKKGKGYQLQFQKLATDATTLFWEAHLDSDRDIRAVCDPLLFFYSHSDGSMLRFVDVNIDEPDRTKALEELQKRHPQSNPDNNRVPGHFYVNAGAVMAAEHVRNFFWEEAHRYVPLLLTKEGLKQQMLNSSPVVIGTIRTNSAMRQMLSGPEAAGLAYRMHPEHFSWVTVARPLPHEIAALSKFGMRMDAAGNGIVETPGNGMLATLSAEITLGTVSRMRHPNGSGVLTFISSYAILNVAQMALALTDEKQLKRIFAQMGWPLDKEVPETFEMMFLVRLAPGNLDDHASEAELLCWRPLK